MKKLVGAVLCLLLTFTFATSVPRVHGLQEGPRDPGTVESVQIHALDIEWLNPDNAKVSDDAYATASETVPAGASMEIITERLIAKNFGFSIPSDSIITGIEVEIERYISVIPDINGAVQDNGISPVNHDSVNNGLYRVNHHPIDARIYRVNGGYAPDLEVYLVKDGSNPVGSNEATSDPWPFSDTDSYYSYGGDGYLWSESWTLVEVNSANFGVLVSAIAIVETNFDAIVSFNIDHIRITVYYTPEPSMTVESDTGTPIFVLNPEVCSQFTINIWIRNIPENFDLNRFEISIRWDPSLMELVEFVDVGEVEGRPVDSFYIGGLSRIIYSVELTDSWSEDAVWARLTFHCLGEGSSTILVESPSGATIWLTYGEDRIPVHPDPVEITCNQHSMSISPRPYIVGGYYAPVNRFAVLWSYLALVSLACIVSAILVIRKKRKS
ncbi:MAG: hypothetical protein NWF08_01980 [Candidatus Bathyarchaeota archaeon]|nr:hypothetical protein [Candidatus Bathyarchaeota archaeon]